MYDDSTGLSYQGARYYDAGTGRFLSEDNAFLAVGSPGLLKSVAKIDQQTYLANPQALNSYAYSFNNPLKYRDADGNFAFLAPLFAYAVMNASWIVPTAITWASAATLAITAPLVGGQIYSYAHGDQAMGDRMGDAAMMTNMIAATGIQALMDSSPVSNETSQVQANKAKGDAFEAERGQSLQGQYSNLQPQVTVKTGEGVRTRVDFMGTDANGNICLFECKSSATAPLTPNQSQAFPQIQQSGGTIVGQGKPGYPGGTELPPTTVNIIRP